MKEFDNVKLGNKLYYLRKLKNISQSEMGKMLGIKQATYSRLESGETSMKIETLFKISDILGVVPEALLFDEDDNDLSPEEEAELALFKSFLFYKKKIN